MVTPVTSAGSGEGLDGQAMTTSSPGRGKAPYHHGDLREALLAAAEQELAAKGIEGFTLRGVAKRAGVSHAAPAHHFRDTSDMLTALVTIAMQRFAAAMQAREAAAGDDPRERFIATGVAYVEFALANPALFDLMFSSKRPDFDDADFVSHATAAFATLVDGVAAIRGDEPMTSEDGRIAIATAWAMVHGLATLLIARRLKFLAPDLEADRESTLRRLVAGVAPGAVAGMPDA